MIIDILIKVVIPLLGIVIGYILIPLINEKLSAAQREKMIFWTKQAVQAAEQMYKAGLITLPKKDYVLSYLEGLGFNITEEELNLLIESAVHELNNL